ncbi:activator of stress genes 1 [Corynascus novoguineensis]|uniref:Activator of stress genes 1 n=1 Tax=Corynascus novoguineensis TaxID=1126955 RepID=A0AAN7CV03_9PEZI|nr:activator of stress genes 1 [Corynascus novoguineensis]
MADHTSSVSQARKTRGRSKQRIAALENRLAALESKLRQHEAGQDVLDKSLDSSNVLSGTDGSGRFPPSLPLTQLFKRFTLWQQETLTKPLDIIRFSPFTLEAPEMRVIELYFCDVCEELPFLKTHWLLNRLERTSRANVAGVSDAWWQGLAHAIIASVMHIKTVNSSFRDVAIYSWTFFRNAYAVLPELIIQGDNLGAAQAVMAMAMFMRLSADSRTTAHLVSMAIRMQLLVGLHIETISESILSTDEEENRARLFWAAYMLDMEMSLNTGHPPVHANQNIAVALPDHSRLGDGNQRDTVFRFRSELARIQQRVSTLLTTPNEPYILDLESELEAWSLRLPLEIRPNWPDDPRSFRTDQAMDVSVAMLHFAYYNSLSTACWESSSQAIESLERRTSRHKSVARAAARATISTLSRFPTHTFAELWKALYYPVSASIVLLAVVCKEPAHSQAPDDLALLSWFVRYLDRLVRDEGCDLRKMRDGISAFEKVAAHAVNTARRNSNEPVDPALWPIGQASGQTGRDVATLLTCTTYHPMHVAQSFMGNLLNRDTCNAKRLAELLGLSWDESGYGPFVPELLMPATYGFAFASNGQA